MEIKVRNAVQALESAAADLRRKDPRNAPAAGLNWQEKTLYSPDPQDLAVTSRLFTSGGWQVEVSQNVAPLSRTVYRITVFNAGQGWHWQGRVSADGSVVEEVPFSHLSPAEIDLKSSEFSTKSRVPPHPPGGYGH